MMLNFRKIELSDKVWVDELLKYSDYRATEFCFTTMFIWAEIFKSEIARYGDFVLLRSMVDDAIEYMERTENRGEFPDKRKKAYYVLPVGRGDLSAILPLLVADARALGRDFCLTAIPPALVPDLEAAMPGLLEFHEARDTFDYIYDAENFRNLPGTRFQARRNQISVFKRSNHWTYECISATDDHCLSQIVECMEMTKEWCRIKDCEKDISMWHERGAVLRALENFRELGLRGGLIRVHPDTSASGNGRVIAYTIGEPVSRDTFIIHIEKAFTEYRGAYPTIAHEFLEHEISGFTYVNREDDAGNEGLRKAKLSYHPAFFEEKFYAMLRSER